MEQTGTPQNPVDWSDPDTWIEEKLSGDEANLAKKIWEQSGYTLNPRHTTGVYLFINQYGLAVTDDEGIYQVEEKGKAFIEGKENHIRELDEREGLPQLLSMLAIKTRAKLGDLLPDWEDFLKQHSKFGKPSTIKDTLRRRLANLNEREFVQREGNTYVITQQGLAYASSVEFQNNGSVLGAKAAALDAVSEFNKSQRQLLSKRLSEMHPYSFEQLVRELLEAMGYEDVTVTKQSGDKGVDVVATVQFGITTIMEVVQVKRQQGNIQRQLLDQLRGALPYHGAIRGTLITLGSFSKGCRDAALFPGAAPIGLIDGSKLLDLLIEHNIGIIEQKTILYELDEALFESPSDAETALAESLE